MSIFELLKSKVKNSSKQYRIVFPEGNDPRILKAVRKLKDDNVVSPIILGDPEQIKQVAQQEGISLDDLLLIDIDNYENLNEMVVSFIQARGKEITESEVRKALKDANYFGTMMVKMGIADGMVSGAVHSTAETVRPALQLVHTAEGMHRVSGSFIMERGKEKYLFADCAINPSPDSQTLAEIAYQTVETAKMIDLEPRVAFLSFSTKGSAKGEMVTRTVGAAEIFAKEHPDIVSDGELQFDAAFVPEVAAKKAPDSKLAGRANIFIFPELQSGNIAYKITQRLGNFAAIGPILQGLDKPINDLSRGASSQDVYDLAVLTAAQALFKDKE
ncbi:phosphate acetyltransferase [Lactobacillus sp. M0390]|uniref:phosphate acetyltransferase n=1 Tax=Lactobacillus sp. M0390 TaxID=2751026 RepID=UPI0018DD180F|nr:phosphate acetyltransferase [Lactobacillus sp. M0390]MBH9985131.1 phosphate acetyltransferase [Lactobacillus sp. M0390]